MNDKITDKEAMRLLYAVQWEGPWERLGLWLWKVDPRTSELKGEVRSGGLRARLAAWADRRDLQWRETYIRHLEEPSGRWKRRMYV